MRFAPFFFCLQCDLFLTQISSVISEKLLPKLILICIPNFCLISLQTYDDTFAKIERALAIWSGFGMTLAGVQTCGDYMFSGHTVVITMLNFFVTECKC